MTEDFRIAQAAMVARVRRTGSSTGPVQVTRVHPDVWRMALRIAGGDTGRLVVLGPTAVVVANHSRYGESAPSRGGARR